MNILLVTIGSHGDVHPFVGLGTTLKRRGHDVTLITNEHFAPLARSAGLGFVALGTDEQYRQTLLDREIWHRTRAFKAIFSKAVLPLIEKSYRLIEELYVPGRTVVAASSLAFGARIAQDKLGVPTATVHLQPVVIRTVYDVPVLPGVFLPRWVPPSVKRGVWWLADTVVVDPLMARPINEVRAEVGLPPVRRIIGDWWHSPTRVIGMWPEWFAPTQPDWPEQVRLVGFPLFDESALTPLDPELDRWLEGGEPPIAFTAGSAMIHGRDFFDASIRACVKLNRRGLLLTRFGQGQISNQLPATVRHVEYAPFGTLLPRCAALVHHGGIGTTAQALRAGMPQLVMPMAHDQPDNAARVRRLGVGFSIPPRSYRTGKVVKLLNALIKSSSILQHCQEIARRFEDVDALKSAGDLIEQLPSSARPSANPATAHN